MRMCASLAGYMDQTIVEVDQTYKCADCVARMAKWGQQNW